jgi:hypothetical protein
MVPERRRQNCAKTDSIAVLQGTELVDKWFLFKENPLGPNNQRPSGVSAKPAMRGHFKTGHVRWPGT